jgi:hypothetical protein
MRDPHIAQGRDLHVVAPEATLVTTAERRLAIEHWLLAGSQNRDRTRMEWQEHGVAMLPLGARFSAIRLPGRLVYALAGTDARADADAFLEQALDGPVICDQHHPRYYALVSASVPVTWRQAAGEWRTVDVDCLGRGTILGVPRVDAVGSNSGPYASYWSVPMPSAGILCAPLQVARLIAAAQVMLHEEPET